MMVTMMSDQLCVWSDTTDKNLQFFVFSCPVTDIFTHNKEAGHKDSNSHYHNQNTGIELPVTVIQK